MLFRTVFNLAEGASKVQSEKHVFLEPLHSEKSTNTFLTSRKVIFELSQQSNSPMLKIPNIKRGISRNSARKRSSLQPSFFPYPLNYYRTLLNYLLHQSNDAVPLLFLSLALTLLTFTLTLTPATIIPIPFPSVHATRYLTSTQLVFQVVRVHAALHLRRPGVLVAASLVAAVRDGDLLRLLAVLRVL